MPSQGSGVWTLALRHTNRARLYPSFAKEGWTRPKENAAKHPLWSGRGGCFKLPLITYTERFDNPWLETTTPSAPTKERGHFLDGAATPPSRRRGIRVPPTVFPIWKALSRRSQSPGLRRRQYTFRTL